MNYRNLLGGYYSVTQLNEVYGIDEERYNALKSWFTVDTSLVFKLDVNRLPQDSLSRHPYINYGVKSDHSASATERNADRLGKSATAG